MKTHLDIVENDMRRMASARLVFGNKREMERGNESTEYKLDIEVDLALLAQRNTPKPKQQIKWKMY